MLQTSSRRKFLVGTFGFVGAASLPASAQAARTAELLEGSGPPRRVWGKVGAFYIDTRAHALYGPKRKNGWGEPIHLTARRGVAGPTRASGPSGPRGEQGPQGFAVLHGQGPPSPALGVDNDFYIDTASTQLYGPKTGGVWGSPVALGGPPASVVDTDAPVPWDWSYPSENTQKTHFRLTPPSRAPFELASWGSGPMLDGQYDHWIGFGFNAAVFVDRSQGVAGEPAWFMGFEDGYATTGDGEGAEWYIAYFSPDHETVSLFRPFYTRVQRNNNTDHNALTLLDIGSDGKGLFGVTAGGFDEFFSITANEVVFKPLSGNGFFVLDAGPGATPYLQFRNDSVNGFYFKTDDVDTLTLVDKDNRTHAQMKQGTNSAAAVTELFSGLSVDGDIAMTSAGSKLGFFGANLVAQPAVSGSKSGNVALASLITALADLGLINDTTT
jgi:hypothetical protein